MPEYWYLVKCLTKYVRTGRAIAALTYHAGPQPGKIILQKKFKKHGPQDKPILGKTKNSKK
jgi:hypothetical protein